MAASVSQQLHDILQRQVGEVSFFLSLQGHTIVTYMKTFKQELLKANISKKPDKVRFCTLSIYNFNHSRISSTPHFSCFT